MTDHSTDDEYERLLVLPRFMETMRLVIMKSHVMVIGIGGGVSQQVFCFSSLSAVSLYAKQCSSF